MKESIVNINGNLYRYAYDPSSKKTEYLGPVGSTAEMSETEFQRIVAGDDLSEKSVKQIIDLQTELDLLTGKDVDNIVIKGQAGKNISIEDPATTRLKPATWKSQFIDEYVRVNYGYGSRAKRYGTALKKEVVKGKELPKDWKRKIEDDLIGPGAVRPGSKKYNLIKHLGKKDDPVAQTELKKAGMLPGGRQGGLTLGSWADDGYIIKSKEGKSVFWEIGPLGKKVLER
jgi:hypothetical protein